MDLRDIYPGLNGEFSYIVVILCTVALAIIHWQISKTWDRKVHRTKIDESGPSFQPLPEASHDEGPSTLAESGALFQPLPEASHDEESGPFSQALPGAFHDEAPFSGSFNVSMESKRKNVDVSLNVSGISQRDEASSSGYSDLPKRSEGQDVDVNLNISGAPRCDEAPSSSSSSGPTKSRSDLISSKRKDKVEDLVDLWKRIFDKGNHKKASSLGHFPWPNVPHLQKLEGIVSLRSDLLIKDIHGAVRAILGRVNVATVAPLVVADTLERLDNSIINREEQYLTKVMYVLAIVLKRLSESHEGMQDIMQEATSLIVEGARVFSLQVRRRRSPSELSAITQKLNTMYMHINTEFPLRVFTPIQHQRRSHLSKEYPTHAGAPRCDEAPSSSSSSAPTKSRSDLISSKLKDKVEDVNLDDLWKHISELRKLNISGAPRCDEAPSSSSSSSSGPTKSRSDLISSKRKDKVEDVNLDDLWKHISELWKQIEKGNHEKARSPFTWPAVPGLQKLKEIVSFGTDLDIHGAVRAILGRVNVGTVAALVVADTLERLDKSITNREERYLTKVMYVLAIVLKRLSESPEGMQDVMQEATSLIVEGARVFSLQGGPRRSASEHQRRSHLSKELPTHADNGQVEEDLLLTVQQEVDINTGQVEEDPLGPEPPNDEQVEEDLPVPELQEVDINTGQVEEDPLVPEPPNDEQVEEDLLSSGRLKVFKMEALVDATNNFHEDNKVGQGGFAAVYKGTTHHGKQIAVKKMSFTDEQSREVMKEQFENEKLLAEIRHRNLVNLFGYCKQESEGFLVYEYLPNGSLDKWLSDPENRKRLDWHKRFNIIEGIARGLLHLHQDSQFRLFHRDIKASNILLDEKLNPKITDFGTAKPFPEDRSHVTATTIVGTRGYLAPEYAMGGDITVKVDVYSFGVVLLELLTGKLILNNVTEYLEWVWSSYNQNKVADTIDRTITETWDKEKGKAKAKAKAKALRCFQVALLCIQNDATLRPIMSQVITYLTSSDSLPVPTKPPLVSSPRRSSFAFMLQRRGGK